MKKLLGTIIGVAAVCGIVKKCKGPILKGIKSYFTPEKKARHMLNHLDNVLHLTYAQKDQLEPIITKRIVALHEKSEKGNEFFTSFMESFKSKKFDKENFASGLQGDIIAPKITELSNLLSELHGILTVEQRKKLVTHIEEKKRNGFGCCHPGHGNGVRNNCD